MGFCEFLFRPFYVVNCYRIPLKFHALAFTFPRKLIIAFFRSGAAETPVFCVCFEITIFNFEHEAARREKEKNNRINFNDQWACNAFLSKKKNLFCIQQEYKKPISLPKRKKMLLFFEASALPVSFPTSQSLKLYKSVFYWSLYVLLMHKKSPNLFSQIWINLINYS